MASKDLHEAVTELKDYGVKIVTIGVGSKASLKNILSVWSLLFGLFWSYIEYSQLFLIQTSTRGMHLGKTGDGYVQAIRVPFFITQKSLKGVQIHKLVLKGSQNHKNQKFNSLEIVTLWELNFWFNSQILIEISRNRDSLRVKFLI